MLKYQRIFIEWSVLGSNILNVILTCFRLELAPGWAAERSPCECLIILYRPASGHPELPTPNTSPGPTAQHRNATRQKAVAHHGICSPPDDLVCLREWAIRPPSSVSWAYVNVEHSWAKMFHFSIVGCVYFQSKRRTILSVLVCQHSRVIPTSNCTAKLHPCCLLHDTDGHKRGLWWPTLAMPVHTSMSLAWIRSGGWICPPLPSVTIFKRSSF